MFPIKPDHVRRVSFASKLYPRIKSTLGIDTNKLKSSDNIDGELFCGGRSKNRDLLTFFGFLAESHGSSTFIQLPLFRRSLKKLTDLVERELEVVGAHQVLLPTIIPQKFWEQSGRLERQKNALDYVYKLSDNAKNQLLLGPTYEESMTHLVSDLESLNDSNLPLLLYQTSPKFRYEPTPKFGLIRCNEFLMNDLYTFDKDLDSAKETYEEISSVYKKIFKILDLECIRTEGETGNIGGKYSHEYHLTLPSGEDNVIICQSCKQAYNSEIVQKQQDPNECISCQSRDINKCKALELGHAFLLADTYSKSLGAQYTSTEDGSRLNLQMGCYGLGLTRILGGGIDMFSLVPRGAEAGTIQLRWPSFVEPFKIGIVAPAFRSKQFHSGSSEFIERVSTRVLESTNDDIIIEDRGKESIVKRLIGLQSLGVPYIMVVGQKFLQDPPEVEFLTLNSDKRDYEQHWFTEEQVYDFIHKSNDNSYL